MQWLSIRVISFKVIIYMTVKIRPLWLSGGGGAVFFSPLASWRMSWHHKYCFSLLNYSFVCFVFPCEIKMWLPQPFLFIISTSSSSFQMRTYTMPLGQRCQSNKGWIKGHRLFYHHHPCFISKYMPRWHLHILASELVLDDNLAQTWWPWRAQVLSEMRPSSYPC